MSSQSVFGIQFSDFLDSAFISFFSDIYGFFNSYRSNICIFHRVSFKILLKRLYLTFWAYLGFYWIFFSPLVFSVSQNYDYYAFLSINLQLKLKFHINCSFLVILEKYFLGFVYFCGEKSWTASIGMIYYHHFLMSELYLLKSS